MQKQGRGNVVGQEPRDVGCRWETANQSAITALQRMLELQLILQIH